MRISSIGEICKGFYALGIPRVPVYLLDGPRPVVFDAGYTGLGHVYEEHIRQVLGQRAPALLFLTHTHFDHVGAATHFKSVWPRIKVAASQMTQNILARPSAIQSIRKLSREAALSIEPCETTLIRNIPFEPFNVDVLLLSGHEVELSPDCHVIPIPTPGHTRDFMSYWIPEKKILIASEAVGCPDTHGYISTEFLADFDAYCNSMEYLSELDVQTLCPGHWLVLTDQDAKSHFDQSRKQAAVYVDMVETFLRAENGDIERTIERVKASEWDPRPSPKQAQPAYVLNTRTRVKKVRDRMLAAGRI